jgi:hypothetical protein
MSEPDVMKHGGREEHRRLEPETTSQQGSDGVGPEAVVLKPLGIDVLGEDRHRLCERCGRYLNLPATFDDLPRSELGTSSASQRTQNTAHQLFNQGWNALADEEFQAILQGQQPASGLVRPLESPNRCDARLPPSVQNAARKGVTGFVLEQWSPSIPCAWNVLTTADHAVTDRTHEF